MTDDPQNVHPDGADRLLDRAIDAARSGPSEADSAAARDRVRARLFASAAASPCDSYRADLPALLAGTLSADRAALVDDHARECIPCRKALVAARDGVKVAARDGVNVAARDGVNVAGPAPVPAPPATRRTNRRFIGVLSGLAAAGLAAAVMIGVLRSGHHGAPATVAQLQGELLDASTGASIAQGAPIEEGRAVRTAKASRAILALPDGSRVELNERAQAAFHADGDSLTLDLDRGDLIFEAAKRRERNLFVKTDDCRVAVKGTVFTVRHGLKGSRVGVLEGSVEVDAANAPANPLGPGQQVATDPSLEPQSLDEQVAWSLDAQRWTTLLGAIDQAAADVEREHASREPRFQSAILDAMPDSTVLFAAMPNDGEISDLAKAISDRVSANPELRDWWQQQSDPATGRPENIALVLDTLRRLSDSLGGEVVFSLIDGGDLSQPPMPVVIAGVRDEQELRRLVGELAPQGEAPRFLGAEDLAKLPSGMDHEPLLVLHAGHVLVSPSADALRSIVAGFDGGAQHATAFLSNLEGRYDDGADFILAADLGRTVARRAQAAAESARERGEETPSRLVQALGIPDVDQFVLTAGTHDPGTALLSFREDRSGVAAWLAEPGPIGSLRFVTASSPLAVAALFEDPSRMLQDVESVLPDGKLEELVKSLQSDGVDVREDLVGSLGGEMAIALDGPVLPQPSWKLVLEVDDPARFEAALLAVARHAADQARAEGLDVQEPLVRDTKTSEGPAKALRIGPVEVHYAIRDGYFVAVPNLQLLEAALQASSRGTSLSDSARLVSLLPGGRREDLSLIAWQDASQLAGQLDQAASLLPPEAASLVSAASEPAVGWARASDRAIALGCNSPSGGLGSGIAGLLRRHVVEALSAHALTQRAAAREDARQPR